MDRVMIYLFIFEVSLINCSSLSDVLSTLKTGDTIQTWGKTAGLLPSHNTKQLQGWLLQNQTSFFCDLDHGLFKHYH